MNKSILVVQSDEQKFELLKHQLIELNYAPQGILHCPTIDQTTLYCNHNFFVIIAEFNEESKEGIELLKKNFPIVPILILTENTNHSFHTNVVKMGVQDILVEGEYNTKMLGRTITFARERHNFALKTAEKALGIDEQLEKIPIPLWIMDAASTSFMFANNAAVSVYGYTKDEFGEMTLLDIRPDISHNEFIDNFRKNINDFSDLRYSYHKKKNGELFYVHMYTQQITYNNTPARLAAAIDMHEQVSHQKNNAELSNKLKQQKEQLDNILYSIEDAIWSRRADTLELVYANNAYYQLYGYPELEFNGGGDIVLSSIHADDLDNFIKAVNNIQKTGHMDIVYRYMHRDKTIKTLKTQSKIIKGIGGLPDMMNGITIDITKEQEMLETIRNNEQKLTTTINNTKDLIWSVNSKLELIFCNKPFQDFFLKIAGVLLNEGDYVLGPWHDEAFTTRRAEEYRRAFNGESFTTVVEEHTNNGILYNEISSTPIRGHDGKIIGVNCVARDITTQRKQLLKIQEQNEQFREIAWVQSHRVRTPVSSILGLVPLFDYNNAGNKNNIEILQNINLAAEELDIIIRKVVKSINMLEAKHEE